MKVTEWYAPGVGSIKYLQEESYLTRGGTISFELTSLE